MATDSDAAERPQGRGAPASGTGNDARILHSVTQALAWDGRIDATGIDVIVSGGTVTLSGTVTTASERSAAIEDAYKVPGVRNVIARIEVGPSFADEDEALAAELRATLERDPRVDERLLTVEVTGAIAKLIGTVSTPEEREAAEQDAWETTGVTRVVNSIVVVPLSQREDAEVEASVLAALRADPRLSDPNHINVTSLGGKVYLRGVVRTVEEREAAREVAQGAAGVVEVYNQVVVGELPREARAIRRPKI